MNTMIRTSFMFSGVHTDERARITPSFSPQYGPAMLTKKTHACVSYVTHINSSEELIFHKRMQRATTMERFRHLDITEAEKVCPEQTPGYSPFQNRYIS